MISHPNSPLNSVPPPPTIFRLILLLAVLSFALVGWAQRDVGLSDSRIQELYAQAKAAESSGDNAAAIAKYERILTIAPKLGAAYNNLGLLYFKQGDFEKSVSVLERGLKIDPRMPTASALIGISLSELGRYSDARPRLEAALRLNPDDNNAEKVLANDLIKLGHLEDAATHLQRVANRQPQDQEVWYLLGEVHMQLSQQALSKMNAINPDSELVHEMSGEIMESMKNYDGALVEYKKAADMEPTKHGVHYKLGNVYWTLSQWDAAIEQFQAELVNDPRDCKAQALIADVLIEQKLQFDQGLAQIDKALAICPDLAQAHVDRGRALLKLNRAGEAVKDLETAAQGNPDDASTHFFLAQAYRSVGRPHDAQAEMMPTSLLWSFQSLRPRGNASRLGNGGSEQRSRSSRSSGSLHSHRSGYFANTGFITLFGSGFTS